MWSPRMSMSFTSTKGLQNAPGDNNCFLNSAVQVLWHLDVFRRSFRILSGHACLGNSCIFCALKVIFTQFQFSDQKTLPPDALRKAMAHTFADQQRFQLGLMDDAAECFENILQRIHFHIGGQQDEDMCQARHCISHTKFAMTVVEQVVCQCGATSEPLPFSQMVHYVSTSALVEEAGRQRSRSNSAGSFAQMLRAAGMQGDIRDCPSKCGRKVQIRKNLMNTPDVVSVGLVWDSDRCSQDHIKDVVRSIGTTLSMQELYDSVVDGEWARVTNLHLVGVVCYYGKHYSTFFFHSKQERWISFDDAYVKEMGKDWQSVADKCCRGHYQPLLLLYANPWGEAIDTSTAPRTTYQLTDHRFYSKFKPGTSPEQGVSVNNGTVSTSTRKNLDTRSQPAVQYETNVKQDPPATAQSSARRDTHRYRRALTPNFELNEHTVPVTQRSATPGPEWGRYHSDDEEVSAKGNITHFRQPSYLTAMDIVGKSEENLAEATRKLKQSVPENPYATTKMMASHLGQKMPQVHQNGLQQPQPQVYQQTQTQVYQHPQPVYQQPQLHMYQQLQPQHAFQPPPPQQQRYPEYQAANVQQQQQYQYSQQQQGAGDMKQTHPHYVVQGDNPSLAQDLLGPLPGHAAGGSASGTGGVQQGQVSQDHPDWTLSGYNQYRRQLPVSPARGMVQNAPGYSGPQQPALSTADISKQVNTKSKSCVRADVVRHNLAAVPPVSGTNIPAQTNSGLSTPAEQEPVPVTAFKRTRSLEDSEGHAGIPAAQDGVSKARPHSARPYDYAKSRPVVAPKPGKARPSSARTPEVNTSQETAESRHSAQLKPNLDCVDGIEEEEDTNDMYISRKAVESVLKYQNGPTRMTSVGPSAGAPIDQVPVAYARDATSYVDSKQQAPYIKEVLKVDIPDNLSIGSHKDSGYRSGGSSGDRNSASSASSTSVDSPQVDAFRAYPPALYRVLYPGIPQEAGSRSSTDSMTSVQSSHSSSTVKTPQNTLEFPHDRSSPAVEMQHAALQKEVDLNKNLSTRAVDPLANVNTSRGCSYPGSVEGIERPTGNSPAQQLLMQAEGLMDMSVNKEQEGDLAMALLHCNQALGHLKSALALSDPDQDTKVFVRVKHNLCVLRSRSLHRHIIKRQESSQSNTSGDGSPTEEQPASMALPGCQQMDPKDLIQLEQPEQEQQRQQFKKKVQELYAEGPNKQAAFQANQQHYQVAAKACSQTTTSQQVISAPHMPRSFTDSALSEKLKPQKPPKPKPPVPMRTSSITSDPKSPDATGNDCADLSSNRAEDEKSATLYGTLPRSIKDKSQCCVTPASQPKDEGNMHQRKAAGDGVRQSASTESLISSNSGSSKEEGLRTGPNGLLINHARQWSKEEIRQMLVNDYFSRTGKPADSVVSKSDGNKQAVTESVAGGESNQPAVTVCQDKPSVKQEQQPSKQAALSTDEVVQRRKQAYEEMLSRQVNRLKTCEQTQQSDSVTDSTAPQVADKSQVPTKRQLPQVPRVRLPGGQARPPSPGQHNVQGIVNNLTEMAAASNRETPLHPNITDRKVLYNHPSPFSDDMHQDISWEPTECYPKPSVISEMDKVHQHQPYTETSHWSNAPQKHELRKSASHGQLSSTSGETPADWGVSPSTLSPESRGAADIKRQTSCPDGYPRGPHPVAPPQLPPPYPGKPSVTRTLSNSSNSSVSTVSTTADEPPTQHCKQNGTVPQVATFNPTDTVPVPHTAGCQPPADCSTSHTCVTGPSDQAATHTPSPVKSALAKRRKRKGRNPTKSVTFSDNIALIAVPEEVHDEVDYIAHVSRLIAKKTPPPVGGSVAGAVPTGGEAGTTPAAIATAVGYDSDYDEDTSESCDSDTANTEDKVLCSLCRKRRVTCGATYCQDCNYYMSKFQPQAS